MDKFKGTNGVWLICEYWDERFIEIGTKENQNIALVNKAYDEVLHNARLISTAPELLSALQDLVSLVDNGDLNKYSTEYAKRIINKALALDINSIDNEK
mgnify:CR=1 FL=1